MPALRRLARDELVARLCFELDPDTIAVLHISYVRAIF